MKGRPLGDTHHPGTAPSDMSTPKVIYIGEHGRSGTTIVDRILAEVTGGFSAGEIHRFWAYGLARDWTCSCGVKLRNCDFWGDVLQQSFSECGCTEKEVLEAWRTVARPRSLLSLRYPRLRTSRFQSRLSRYRSFLSTLYRTVSQRSGKRVIVDSSGSPLHGYIISGLRDVEVGMIHLVRDARAVAFSNQTRKPNPSDPKTGATMKTKPVLRVSITWMLYNYLLEGLKSQFGWYEIEKYEEVFDNPRRNIQKTIDKLKIGGKKEKFFVGKKMINISIEHTGQGNPSCFNRGRIDLETECRWIKQMSTVSRFTATVLCCPFLSKYGYV